MADEPRRSGRATKGQHTKMDTPEASPPEPKKPKQKAKAAKKSAEPEPEEDDSGELIRCVCGNQTDEGGRMMVCCDNCNAWQHNECMGVTEIEAELPENYLCELCAPDDHKPLLEAMARGEKPWEDIAQKKQAKKKGRKSKGGRPSLISEAADEAEPRAPSSDGNKRKHEPDPDPPAAKSRKSDSGSRAGAKAAANEPLALVNTIAELFPDSRRNVAASLKKKLSPLINNAVSKGAWKVGRGKTVDAESERFALLVEYALFMNHCGTKPDFSGPYKQQLLRILSNIEKNELIVVQLLNGQLSADSLATMTSEEMASDEHRQKMLEMKLEVEKQSILLQDDSAPKMRRTHKGDEIIEDAANDFTSESIMAAPVRRRESELEPQSPTEQNGAGSPRQAFDATRRSSSFAHSPDAPHSARHEPRAANAPAATRFKEDPNIDNLLGDDGKDEEDYEPADLQPVSWRGPVTMSSHGLSRVLSARLVAGSNLARRIEQRALSSLGDLFPQSLTIGGRIESKRADDYLSSLSQSPSTDVSVFTLSPDVANDAGFDDIYSYFQSRQRYAVIDVAAMRQLSMVRDFYLAPLPAGTQTPQFLERLHRNDLPSNRPRKVLLAVIVCKWATTLDGAQSTPTATNHPIMSPTAPQPQANTPQVTQPPAHGHQYQQNQQYNMPMHQSPSLPGNPYDAPQQQYQQQQQQQQQQQPQAYPQPGSKEALAYEILGPLINTLVAKTVLAQQVVQPDQLHNLKRLLEKHPAAREDLALFSRVLNENPE